MKNLIIIMCAFLLLAGCVKMAREINVISLGMTKQEVISRLGDPVSISATEGREYLNYRFLEQGEDWETSPYYVRLANGKVDAYGRQGDFQPPKQVIEIIKK